MPLARPICAGFAAAVSDAAADFPGLGCNVGKIVLQTANGQKYEFNTEKIIGEALLQINAHLCPAIAMLPSHLSSDILFAQCSFPSDPQWKDNYEEVAGFNSFLRNGLLLTYMRAYNVKALITTSTFFARRLYRLNEARIQRSVFLADPYFYETKAINYQDLTTEGRTQVDSGQTDD